MIFSIMKKIKLTLLALCAVALTGCEAETKEQRDERYSYDIEVITYKGHDYIVLSATKWCNGITHDPDCPCHDESNNNK